MKIIITIRIRNDEVTMQQDRPTIYRVRVHFLAHV